MNIQSNSSDWWKTGALLLDLWLFYGHQMVHRLHLERNKTGQLQHYCRSNSKSRLQLRRPWVYIRHPIWISLVVVLSRVLTKRIVLEFGCWLCFAVRHDCFQQRLTVVLSPAVSSDYIHLRVVSLLSAVNSDENILKHAGRVDICLRDVGHESRCPRLGAHLDSCQRPH